MYHVWIVNSRDLQPIRLSDSFKDEHEALASCSRILTGLGAPLLAARNTERNNRLSLLVYDPTGTLPVSALVDGAVLSEDGRTLSPHETTETVMPLPAGPGAEVN